jgi:hypothetical protein
MAASHPLQNTWVLWEHKQAKNQHDYENSMREVCEFSTVEDFWRHWSFIPRPSEVLSDGKQHKEIDGRLIDGFSVFKKGIRPEWEDPMNKTGADFSLRKTMSPEALDAYWENMVLGLIGETMDAGKDVCGCRVVGKNKPGKGGPVRTIYRLELWMAAITQEVADKIKVRFLDVLTDGDGAKQGDMLKNLQFKRR